MNVAKIQQYIVDNQLFGQSDKIIIGLSGGADSLALLDVLHHLGYSCVAAHCNFHLRGEESNRDAKHVAMLCQAYNIELHSVDFDTQGYAQEKSISIEMAARELRYNWFEQLRIDINATHIAVAHHMDDSVETVLLNLIRGTGIRGLTGISARNGYIVRPLLETTRQEIITYLSSQNIQYVDDSTNSEDIYTRNNIRLNILPIMESINPSVKKSINSTSQYLRQVQNIYLTYISQAKQSIVCNNKIAIDQLLQYDEPQAILYELLSDYNFNGATSNLIFKSLAGESGKLFYSDTHQILKDRKHLIINTIPVKDNDLNYEIEKGSTTLSYPIYLELEELEYTPCFEIIRDTNILYINHDLITYPLVLRKWQQGDWFIPFGMKGRKKVSDFFTDLKFSLFDKENTWILCSGGNIIWIVGHRSDNRYRLTAQTKNVLTIRLS